MPGFIPTIVSATRHGAYGLERQSPLVVNAPGTGQCCIVGQFPWGPAQSIFKPTGLKQLLDTIAPLGFDRTTSAFMAVLNKGWALPPFFIRVIGASAVAASVALVTATPTTVTTLAALYPGTEGNTLVATVSNSTDAVSTHWKLTVTKTTAFGTLPTEVWDNIDTTSSPPSLPNTSTSLVIAPLTVTTAGRPVNGTYALATGTNGSIAAADYVGTPGNGDKGFALQEGNQAIRHFCMDDCGSSLRAVANAGGAAHAYMIGERVFYQNGNSGQSLSAVQSDSATYTPSTRVVYCDPWAYAYDSINSTERLGVSAPFFMSVAAQLPVSTSIAWKNAVVQQMLQGISRLEFDRGNGAGSNSALGIATLINEDGGGHTIEAGVVTMAAIDPSKRNLTRTRVGDYIVLGFTKSARPLIDAPNVAVVQQDIVLALAAFMDGLKRNATIDPINLPHVIDYKILDLNTENSQATIAAGYLYIPLEVQTSSGIEKLILAIQFGEGVTIR